MTPVRFLTFEFLFAARAACAVAGAVAAAGAAAAAHWRAEAPKRSGTRQHLSMAEVSWRAATVAAHAQQFRWGHP